MAEYMDARRTANLDAIRQWSERQGPDGTTASTMGEMELAKREWLSKVMETMAENTAGVLRECADTIAEPEPEGDDAACEALMQRKVAALDGMRERCEDLDNAKDLHKVGGLVPLILALRNPHAELRWRAADALGTSVQNNPDCQQWAFEHGALETLLFLAEHEQEEKPRSKVLYALSCLTRGFAPTLEHFLTHGAGPILKRALARESVRDRNRALFMLSTIWGEAPPAMRAGYWRDVWPELVACASLHNEDEVMRETALGVLQTALAAGEEERDAARAAGLDREMEALQAKLRALTGEEAEWAEEQLRLVGVVLGALAEAAT